MNITRSDAFSWRTLFAWPIWLRIVVGVVLAALIPTVIAFVFVNRTVNTVDQENIEAYLTDRGNERLQQLLDTLNRAEQQMINFGQNRITYQALLAMLQSEPGPVRDAVAEDLVGYMDDQLVGSGSFEEVWLLSSEGIVLLTSNPAGRYIGTTRVAIGQDQSQTAAYLSGRSRVVIRDDQQTLLSREAGELDLEIVQVIYVDDEAVGYVVARIDQGRAVIPQLTNTDEFIEVHSYLATEQGEVIVSQGWREEALVSVQSTAPLLDPRGKNIEIYPGRNVDYIGYFVPVPGLPLFIVTEANTDVSFMQTLHDLFNQGPLVLLGVLVLGGGIAALLSLTIVAPIHSLRANINTFGVGDVESPVPTAQRRDEIGLLAKTFVQAREQVKSLLQAMEERLAVRTRDIQATQEVSRFAVSQRDLQTMMDSVVDLIVDLFPNIYHAQIFLADQDEQYAVLRASTGEAGRQLLDRGHRLEIGSVSVIGQATGEGRVILARDTSASETHRKNEFLPDTRSELAIPLRIGDRPIGALDVQSNQSGTFEQEQIDVLQTMADQIAIAIENARLYQESIQQLEALQTTHRQTTGRAWNEYMNARRQRALDSEAGAPLISDITSLRQQAILQEKAVVGEETVRNTVPFAVPIQLRGRTLGAVEWELPTADFNSYKLQLAQELVNRLAISLDNARLFQESRRAINRERLVNEIAARLTGQTDIDEILQTAVREVGRALGAPQVNINLTSPENT